jgi:hypothetical protein
MLDWPLRLGAKVHGAEGGEYSLAYLVSSAPDHASYRDDRHSAVIRVWKPIGRERCPRTR